MRCHAGLSDPDVSLHRKAYPFHRQSSVVVKRRVDLRIGDQQIRVLKVSRAKAGDVYIAPPTPTGLHISQHASGKKHVRDNTGLHRDLLDPTPEDALTFATQFAYAPEDAASLVVIKRPDFPLAQAEASLGVVDLTEAFRRLAMVEVVRMEGRALPGYVLQNRGVDLYIIDETAQKLALVLWKGDAFLALAFGEDFDETMRAVGATNFGQKTVAPITGSLKAIAERIEAGELPHPWAGVDMDRMNADLEQAAVGYFERLLSAPQLPKRPGNTGDGPSEADAGTNSHVT